MLTECERATLAAALDALLPSQGQFPWPSSTGVIDDFFIPRVPPAGTPNPEWPGLDAAGLRAILAGLPETSDAATLTLAVAALERDDPITFLALWRLAVFAYYSRPEVIAAIAADLAPAYHGAPLPLGYAHILTPWDRDDPLQHPRRSRGSYTPTTAVQRVDLDRLRAVQEREAGA